MPIGKTSRASAVRTMNARVGGNGGAVIKPSSHGGYGPYNGLNMTRFGPPVGAIVPTTNSVVIGGKTYYRK